MSCAVFDVNDDINHNDGIAVLAGHFPWNIWNKLSNYNNTNTDTNTNPPCFVMGRNPVDRAISYYYQRCYNSSTCIGNNRRINDLSAGIAINLLITNTQY
jgi:hypothetical protein